jgi:outer membrane protein OmpA-like peptidoglycan-associated protein
MSARAHSPVRHRGRRKGRGGRSAEQGAPAGGVGQAASAGRGMPRYLSRPKVSEADVSSASEREAKGAEVSEVREAPVATPLGRAAAGAMQAGGNGRGRTLGAGERGASEQRLGADFGNVRVTENSALAAAFGANAMTFGNAIHFAPGHRATPELLGHELTHVAQQRRFGAEGAQFDVSIGAVEDTGLGMMDISMVTGSQSTGGSTEYGMVAEIDFFPHSTAPYANRIGLIQTADVEQLSQPGEPDFNWTGSAEANREAVKNAEGSFVDTFHAGLPADGNTEPWYWQGIGGSTPDSSASVNRFGWNRSSADQGSAHLWDFPKWNQASRFEFETVALGRDNRTVYGAVRWGFETDGTTGTSHEWYDIPEITTSGGGEAYQSAGFDEALQNFRNFYVHEPVIVYFGYNDAVPGGGELDKLGDVSSFMTDNPDAIIRLTASADMTGGVGASNRRLALERMNAVHAELLAIGIPADRIVRDETGANASRAQGSHDPALENTEGSLRANRRVTLTFENTMSRPP